MDYIVDRLIRGSEGCQALGAWLSRAFAQVKLIPTYIKPKYFDVLYTVTYSAVLKRTW